MRSWHRSRRRLAAWAMTLCSLTLLLAFDASGQSASPAGASPSATATDACSVLREAYRLRLGDLAQARHDSTVAVARERARGDSLAVRLLAEQWRAEAAEARLPRWYERASLLVPVTAILVATAMALGGNLAR